MQSVDLVRADSMERVFLPDPDDQWMPGRRWGDAALLLTPAWIARQVLMCRFQGAYADTFTPGATPLAEVVVFCLLSGFGIRAEVALAAHRQLASRGLFDGAMSEEKIEATLRERIQIGRSGWGRYRFPTTRARYLHAALAQLAETPAPKNARELKEYLLGIPGIGLKTASFIVRNHLGFDGVAIIDIHILRAGRIARLFPAEWNLPKDYAKMEERFLAFAMAAGLPASYLDIALWDVMRGIPMRRLDAADLLNRSLTDLSRPTVRCDLRSAACFDPTSGLAAA